LLYYIVGANKSKNQEQKSTNTGDEKEEKKKCQKNDDQVSAQNSYNGVVENDQGGAAFL
jgi:hypothetical protein